MDNFCKRFEPALNQHLLEENKRKHQRHSGLSLSELMCAIYRHQRNLVETAMHRFKRLGERLHARKPVQQAAEVYVR